MRNLYKISGAVIITSLLSLSASADVDPALKSMLANAVKSGNSAHIAAIEKVAIATWPGQAEEIKAMVISLRQSKAAPSDTQKPATPSTEKADKTEPAEDPNAFNYYLNPALWNGQLELGGGTSTGNTEEQGLSVGLSFKRIFAKTWEHDLDADFDFARRQGITMKRKILGEYKLLWKPWDQFYTMNFLKVEADKFSGYKYRITENIGIGYEIINKNNMLWRIEGGPGMRYNKFYENATYETDFLGRVSNTFEMDIMKNLKLANKTSAIFAEHSTTYDNKAQLSARFNSHLAAKLSFSVKHDTNAPDGKDKTDTVSRATIVYDF